MRVSRPNCAYACVKVWVPKMDDLGPKWVQKWTIWVQIGSKNDRIGSKLGPESVPIGSNSGPQISHNVWIKVLEFRV